MKTIKNKDIKNLLQWEDWKLFDFIYIIPTTEKNSDWYTLAYYIWQIWDEIWIIEKYDLWRIYSWTWINFDFEQVKWWIRIWWDSKLKYNYWTITYGNI